MDTATRTMDIATDRRFRSDSDLRTTTDLIRTIITVPATATRTATTTARTTITTATATEMDQS